MRMQGLKLFLATITIAVVTFSSLASASVTWDVSASGQLLKNGVPVIARGFSTTCLEYLLRGIGTDCLCQYDFNNPARIISSINRAELDSLYAKMLPAPAGVQPTLRLTLNAGYYLDVPTPNWSANRARFPGLSDQYKALIDGLVADATSRGIVMILDLHWNDDVKEQEPMALKGDATTGDSLTFWRLLSLKFANNPLVWYELYNEPFSSSYDVWLNGNNQFEGMKPMAAQIRANNIKGMILVAGARNFAYDAQSLIDFARDAPVDKILFVFHPYMGPLQQGDPGKSAVGFSQRLRSVLTATKRPVVVTELGQFCCAAEGACFQYPGNFNGQPMGYVRALMTEMQATSTSWTAWAYRPGVGGDCNQPDMNDGRNLYVSANHNGLGANWVSIFPAFYGALGQAQPTNAPVSVPPPTFAPTQPTKAPTQPTKAPTQPTNAPVQPTNAPTQPTKAPTQPPIVGTSAPTQPTKAPTAPTKAPTQPPVVGTSAPTTPTKAPTAPTKAPTAPTKAPTAPTKAPTAPTNPAPTLPPTNGNNNTPAPSSAPPGVSNQRFDIQTNFMPSAAGNQAVVAAVNAAAARWMQVITADFGTRVTIKAGQTVCGLPAFTSDVVIDDLMVFVEIVNMDGLGAARANAGACGFDNGNRPRMGILQIDSADVNDAMLNTLVAHEFGHILGLGSEWRKRNFVVGANLEYFASNGAIGHREIGGTGRPQVETTPTQVHWRETTYGSELMTPSLRQQKQLSKLSVRALNDLGFTINADRADPFTLSNSGRRLREEEDDRELQGDTSAVDWERAWDGPVAFNLGEESKQQGSSTNVAGVAIGSLVGIAALASAFVLYKRRQHKNELAGSNGQQRMVSANPMWTASHRVTRY